MNLGKHVRRAALISGVFISALLAGGCQPEIRGVSSGGVSEMGSTSNPAGPANILSTYEAWDATGTKMTGTMTNQGALDATGSFPGPGFYSGVVNNIPAASQIVSGITILGITGSVDFGALASSDAPRDLSTAQITLQSEVTTYAGNGSSPNLPAGYRDVPDVVYDDDGQYNGDAGCTADCTPIISITSAQHIAFGNCGTATSVAGRISQCETQNGATATWNGATESSGGEGTWKMVTRQGANNEVWQDQRTGLLWSSRLTPAGLGDVWCRAAGSGQANDPASYCNSATYQPQIGSSIVESECAESYGGFTVVAVPGWCSNGNAYDSSAGCTGAGGTWTANTENFGTGSYSAAKGGMGANSSTLKVRWRLPTVHDYEQAEVDGIRYVMPDMNALATSGGSEGTLEWTTTIESYNRYVAWGFSADRGGVSDVDRLNAALVRCVGR